MAEVSARFTLDAMPGKQMAIDADLSSGLIDEETARQRRSDTLRLFSEAERVTIQPVATEMRRAGI